MSSKLQKLDTSFLTNIEKVLEKDFNISSFTLFAYTYTKLEFIKIWWIRNKSSILFAVGVQLRFNRKQWTMLEKTTWLAMIRAEKYASLVQ